MLGHSPYYHKHFKKYVTIFGTLFNDLTIVRDNGTTTKTIAVPLSYGKKDKALDKLREDPELMNSWDKQLPRMAFYASNQTYDPTRKQNSINQYTKDVSTGLTKSLQYSPAPYDIEFDLSIWVKYYEDGFQIVEQILPFFQPEYVVAVKEVPSLNIERDVHIVLNSVTVDDSVEGAFQDQRIIEWTLNFTLKGYFFGPVEDKAIIKETTLNMFVLPEGVTPNMVVVDTVNPLDANKDEPHTITHTVNYNDV